LIGPNGSGKSTAFNVVAGIYVPTAGRVFYRNQDITGLKPHKVAGRGIARTFQATDVFPDLTVWQNLVAASELVAETGFWATVFAARRYQRKHNAVIESAESAIAMLQLGHARDLVVRGLPHRDQKAVALANALATGADLLMLDEPAAGLTAREAEELLGTFRCLRAAGKTLLIVEHNMRAVMGVCDRITVLNQGLKIAEGTPREIASDERVIEAYLGKPH
jgi:branched-chain amino acid transport system ATP-binding protein